jgi:hypothetical protein
MGLMQLFARRRLYRDLADEIHQHIEEKTDALIADGMSREEAEHAARREFGGRRHQASVRHALRHPAL